jgi:hypothetical protein
MSDRNDLDDGADTGAEQGVVDSARRLGQDARDLGDALSEKTRTVVSRIVGFTMERPLQALAIAAGIGFVLGGGLFTRAGARVLGVGMRLGGIALARRLFTQLAEEARTA